MRLVRSLALGVLFLGLVSCFSREEKPVAVVPAVSAPPQRMKPTKVEETKDKSVHVFARYFEQADAIHREAWWVLNDERRPVGKSPFGKVQRALLSSQNIKLSNKSLFSCDRYLVQRDVLGLNGFPQKAEIFEKCSEKAPAKRIAQFSAPHDKEIQVTFYPENLQEILGIGSAILNKPIQCTLRGNDKEQLISLHCKEWAQDRSKEQMVRLDVYDYQKEGRDLIKLRGKVFENLRDIRKIVADIPMAGKIEVTETELYAPPVEPTPVPTPTPSPAKTPVKAERPANAPPLELPPEGEEPVHVQENGEPVADPQEPAALTPLPGSPEQPVFAVPAAREVVDPDVMMQREVHQQGGPVMDVEPHPENPTESENVEGVEPQGVPHGR
ncbi:hypothetical protein [Bdellovibrio sp. ArHS]|uniref:hypothetical protein n=1 Tax=Bdellovibrio sp. ArHS TaxID=1569284 RepID=UPI000B0F8788|nr:hypothetical protein [Bdellovibrio sp. ArHS]